MRFYRVSDGVHDTRYEGTLSDAHKAAKGSYVRDEVVIEAVEIDTSKENMLRLLNHEGGIELPVGTRWTLSARGGLREETA